MFAPNDCKYTWFKKIAKYVAWWPTHETLLAINAPLLLCWWESTKIKFPAQSIITSTAFPCPTKIWWDGFSWRIDSTTVSSWPWGLEPKMSYSREILCTWQVALLQKQHHQQPPLLLLHHTIHRACHCPFWWQSQGPSASEQWGFVRKELVT